MNFKKPKADLRATYKLTVEISIIVSLAILILAFKFFPHLEDKGLAIQGPQELFTVEDIQQTKQENRPPPPPKPPIPIEAPADDVLEDIEIEDTEIDFDAEIQAPPPPKEEIEEEPTYFPIEICRASVSFSRRVWVFALPNTPVGSISSAASPPGCRLRQRP